MSKEHRIKTVQPYFDECWHGRKPFEVRKNDRDYQVGDKVVLQEYDSQNNRYTERGIEGIILYVLKDYAPIDSQYVVFSYEITNRIYS